MITIRYLWDEGYLPAALLGLTIVGLIGLYFLFQARGWPMLWYWLLVSGLAVGGVAGYVRARLAGG